MKDFFCVKNNIKVFKFSSIETLDLVEHFYTSRHGGASSSPYDSLNLGLNSADCPENITENKRLFFEAFGVYPQESVTLEHKDVIFKAEVPEDLKSRPCADAVITNSPGLPLVICYADCVGIFVVDPVKKAISLIHAGWRGTLLNIAFKAVKALVENYGSSPGDCIAGIAPSIGPCCFYTDEDVALSFFESFSKDYPDGVGKRLKESVVKLSVSEKYSVNLWSINKIQLEYAGLKEKNISISSLCTSCRRDLFYSYRRDSRVTGRMAGIIMLK